jgi:hypothetical protein
MTATSSLFTARLRGRRGVVPFVFTIALLAAALAGAGSAHAATQVTQGAGTTTTIGFDDLADTTVVSDQYAAQGVTFIDGVSIPGYSGCCFPVVTSTPAAHSGAKVGSAYAQCRVEFCTPGVAGRLTSFASFVRVFVGAIGHEGSPRTVTLTAYDGNLQQVGRQTATLPDNSVSARLEVDPPSQEIAYFTVQADDYNTPVGIDDLSFDVPATPPPADFQLSVPSQLGIYAYPGGAGSESIGIQRFNGSSGPIQFSAPNLPSGWTASFDPNPASGTSTSTKVTITPSPGAATASATNVVIDAQPQSTAAGVSHRQITIPVNVRQPIGLTSTTATLGACKTSLPVTVYTQSGWHQPVTVSVVSPRTASVSPSHIDADSGFYHQLSLTVSGTDPVTLRLQSGTYWTDVTVHLDTDLAITNIDQSGRSYGDWNRDTLIQGSGFCQGAKVQIGAQSADRASTPDWISPDGKRMTVRVAPEATTGTVTVSTNVASATSSDKMFVDNYRNTNGFSFHNYTPHITFDQMTQAFGHDQTYDCLGIDACFRDPWAMAVNAIANAFLDKSDGGGACFGFALGSLRIYSGSLEFTPGKLVDQFPHAGGADVFGIDPAIPAGGSDGPITDYLNAMAVSQLSDEFLGHYISTVASQIVKGGATSARDVYAEINDSLHSHNADFPVGTYPLIALRDGGSGHVVVAYDLEGTPDDYYIDVYDPNRQFAADESTNNSTHEQNLKDSRVHVDSDGHWQLPSTGMVGDMAGLVVTRPTDLPKFNPTLVGTGLVEKGVAAVLFASSRSHQRQSAAPAAQAPSTVTQVTGAAGKTMFDAAGNLNANPATRLRAAPFAPLVGSVHTSADSGQAPFILLPASESTVRETVKDTGTGSDTHVLMAHGALAEIDTQANAGSSDQLTLAPAGSGARFATDASRKPVTLTLMGAFSHRREAATVTTTSFRGGSDSVAFSGGGLVLRHRGAATTLTMRLAVSGAGTVPTTFLTGPVPVPANGTARIARVNWASLGTSSLRLSVGGRALVLRNRLSRLPRVSIVSLRAKRLAGHRVALAVQLARHSLPGDAQLSLQWTLRRRSKAIATTTQLVNGRTRSATYTAAAQPGTSYRGTVTVTALRTRGIAQDASQPATRSVTITS